MAAKDPGLIADGGGLYLQISQSGSKSWVFRFMLNRRSREMGLGSLNAVSLSLVREKASQCRTLLADGIDPIEYRDAEKSKQIAHTHKNITFREASESYITSHSAGWKNAKHAAQWASTLNTYAYPILGEVYVSDIDTSLVVQVLDPIWSVKTETASRVRGRIEKILSWATVSGYRKGENPARWRGHLDNLMPPPSRMRRVKHHAAMPYSEVGNFIQQLRNGSGVSHRALEFAILTAARTQEVLGSNWNEIDFETRIWTVPAERMKGLREHRIPLVDRAIEILAEMRSTANSRFVFPGNRPNKGLSNMSLLAVLRRLQIEATAHGFRSSFRDWASEVSDFPSEVAEQALAHVNKNKVEAAYRRGDLFVKRQRLMEAWATYLEKPQASVIPIRSQHA